MSHSTRKLGNAFTWLGWITGFFLLALLFDNILEQQLNPNQTVNTVQTGVTQEIRLKRNRHGHYLLNGFINEKEVTFLIDTGATTTSIPAALGQKLGLKKGHKFTVQTANGSSFAYATTIRKLRLGNMEFNNISASLNPGLQTSEILLGMNILKNIELIQRGDTLTLKK